jgi:hypothetical protein
MSELKNSKGKTNSKSIYDITHKIEEELTYIYEMRMKQVINPSESKKNDSEKINTAKVLSDQTLSLFAR